MYKISDYPSIAGNFFLGGRAEGASQRLIGNVNILTVFLRREGSDWSEEAKNKYYDSISKAADFLMSEAKRYGATLHIRRIHLEKDVPADADPKDGYALVKDYFHKESVNEVQDHYRRSLGADEVPIILAFNTRGRSFAFKKNANEKHGAQEISVIFFENGDSPERKKTDIAHELLHQFGAVDYYFPEEVKETAKKYIGNSIMGIGSPVVDDLTAYLVGWKDTVCANSYWFLKETMWLNEDLLAKEKRKQWQK